MSDDRATDHGPFGLFDLEIVVKPDGRLLHLYTWPLVPDPPSEQATDAEPPTPHHAADPPDV